MPVTPQEFAATIKRKYPQYANVPDAELVQQMISKYPQYKDQISMAAPPQAPPPTSQPEQPPGFLGGIAETALPSTKIADYWKGGAYLMQHPLESAKIVADSILSAHKEQFAKAGQEWKEGRYVGAASRAVAGATPLIGPMSATAYDRMAGGEVARGLGNVVGMMVPQITRGAASAVKPFVAATKVTGPTISGVSIPLTRGQRLNKPGWRITEGIIKKTIPGAGPFNKYAALQQ